MAYTLPVFNLNFSLWRFPNLPPFAATSTGTCNLAYGRRGSIIQSASAQLSYLLVPKGFDIRASALAGGIPDFVEVPTGSGRCYTVVRVEDIGKGFPNEHRVAVIGQTAIVGTMVWPQPTP